MSGEQFEAVLCQIFKMKGYWALNIPKNRFGAQPFDVLAIKKGMGQLPDVVYAVDGKVCGGDSHSHKRLRLSRIEDNQWLSFGNMQERTRAFCGFACLYNDYVYFVPYDDAVCARDSGQKSVELRYRLFDKPVSEYLEQFYSMGMGGKQNALFK